MTIGKPILDSVKHNVNIFSGQPNGGWTDALSVSCEPPRP